MQIERLVDRVFAFRFTLPGPNSSTYCSCVNFRACLVTVSLTVLTILIISPPSPRRLFRHSLYGAAIMFVLVFCYTSSNLSFADSKEEVIRDSEFCYSDNRATAPLIQVCISRDTPCIGFDYFRCLVDLGHRISF
jgi:hypothetical protein